MSTDRPDDHPLEVAYRLVDLVRSTSPEDHVLAAELVARAQQDPHLILALAVIGGTSSPEPPARLHLTALRLVDAGGAGGVDLDRSDEELRALVALLAYLVRCCLGNTTTERREELARLSAWLRLDDLADAAGLEVALSAVGQVVEHNNLAAVARDVPSSSYLPGVACRLAWMARGLLGDTDDERACAVRQLSLDVQLAALEDRRR